MRWHMAMSNQGIKNSAESTVTLAAGFLGRGKCVSGGYCAFGLTVATSISLPGLAHILPLSFLHVRFNSSSIEYGMSTIVLYLYVETRSGRRLQRWQGNYDRISTDAHLPLRHSNPYFWQSHFLYVLLCPSLRSSSSCKTRTAKAKESAGLLLWL